MPPGAVAAMRLLRATGLYEQELHLHKSHLSLPFFRWKRQEKHNAKTRMVSEKLQSS